MDGILQDQIYNLLVIDNKFLVPVSDDFVTSLCFYSYFATALKKALVGFPPIVITLMYSIVLLGKNVHLEK